MEGLSNLCSDLALSACQGVAADAAAVTVIDAGQVNGAAAGALWLERIDCAAISNPAASNSRLLDDIELVPIVYRKAGAIPEVDDPLVYGLPQPLIVDVQALPGNLRNVDRPMRPPIRMIAIGPR